VNASKGACNKALMAAYAIILVNTNCVSFIIPIDSVGGTAFHAQGSVTVLADYGNVNAMFFITNNREERPGGVVFLVVAK
jgi:hypothetical protein